MYATHPITRLNPSPLNRLHHTPLLIRHIPHPIRLPRRNEHMRRPPADIPIQLIFHVYVEFRRVADRA